MRRLIVEFRFHWRKRNSQANQTKHGQTYPFIVAQKKGKQTKQSNQTWTNSIIASHPPKCICNFICIQWFVCACQCLPVVASLGSLRSPRSACEAGLQRPFHKLSRNYIKIYPKNCPITWHQLHVSNNLSEILSSLCWRSPEQNLIDFHLNSKRKSFEIELGQARAESDWFSFKF